MAPFELAEGDVVLLRARVAHSWPGQAGIGLHVPSPYGDTDQTIRLPPEAIAEVLWPALKRGDRVRMRRNGMAGQVLAADEALGFAWVSFGASGEPATIAFKDLSREPKAQPSDEPEPVET